MWGWFMLVFLFFATNDKLKRTQRATGCAWRACPAVLPLTNATATPPPQRLLGLLPDSCRILAHHHGAAPAQGAVQWRCGGRARSSPRCRAQASGYCLLSEELYDWITVSLIFAALTWVVMLAILMRCAGHWRHGAATPWGLTLVVAGTGQVRDGAGLHVARGAAGPQPARSKAAQRRPVKVGQATLRTRVPPLTAIVLRAASTPTCRCCPRSATRWCACQRCAPPHRRSLGLLALQSEQERASLIKARDMLERQAQLIRQEAVPCRRRCEPIARPCTAPPASPCIAAARVRTGFAYRAASLYFLADLVWGMYGTILVARGLQHDCVRVSLPAWRGPGVLTVARHVCSWRRRHACSGWRCSSPCCSWWAPPRCWLRCEATPLHACMHVAH